MGRRTLYELLLIVIFLLCWQGKALAASPLGVINSEKNRAAYQDQHLGNYDEDWLAVKHTVESANIRYDQITDADLIAGAGKLSGYKTIILPLLNDLPVEAQNTLGEWLNGGGKLLITDGGGTPSATAQAVEAWAGARVDKHVTTTDSKKLIWHREPLPVAQPFPIGTLHADVTPTEAGAAVAKWYDANDAEAGCAITRKNGCIFFPWALGLQGEITSNANFISLALEDLSPGITQQAAVQISFADYQNIKQELDFLTKRTEEVINTAKQADLAVPFNVIQKHYESALVHVNAFNEAYKNRQFYRADEELADARHEFSLAFAQSMPVRPVEARAIWLDRGTIVSTKGPDGMSALFDRLKAAGINVVYFETNNAGFTMYKSRLSEQNPDTLGWDPLGAAVAEARKRGMELHAWIWVFAVGNMKHNPIIGREPDYPGPVLSTHNFTWALAAGNGSLLPNNQPEFWLDPSNPQCRQFVKDLVMEVVQKYPVDGIQLDYIRYPFNNRGSEMGFNWYSRTRFEKETGLSLDKLDDESRQIFQHWKIQQVNEFVKDLSFSLRRLKGNLRISAAVYAMPRRMRLNAIQQEWETWVKNGWVDTLNPMSYVVTATDLSNMAGSVRESSDNKALVYPGLSIRQLDTAGLIEQLDTSRAIGTLGTTIFAVAQLDDKKLNVLRLGPYRKQTLLTPQSNPLRASRLLVDNFAALVNRYLQDPTKRILSDQSSTNEVMSMIMSLQRDMHRLGDRASADEIDSVAKQVATLDSTVKDWLRLEAFVQRGFRAQYIANYLSQVQAILSYAAHKSRTHESIVAGARTASVEE